VLDKSVPCGYEMKIRMCLKFKVLFLTLTASLKHHFS
jgi:hypothetical protein